MKLTIVIEKMENVDILRRKTMFCYIKDIFLELLFLNSCANEENLNVKSKAVCANLTKKLFLI